MSEAHPGRGDARRASLQSCQKVFGDMARGVPFSFTTFLFGQAKEKRAWGAGRAQPRVLSLL
jgi:hypothetical protein